MNKDKRHYNTQNLVPGHVRHGAWLWLHKGEMPADCAEIRAGIEQLADDLAVEFGAEGRDLTPAQVVLVDRVVQLVGFTKLCEVHAWRTGPIVSGPGGKPRMAPALRESYVAYSNAVVKALRTLDELSREKRESGPPALDLRTYLERKAAGETPEGRNPAPQNQADSEAGVRRVSEGSD